MILYPATAATLYLVLLGACASMDTPSTLGADVLPKWGVKTLNLVQEVYPTPRNLFIAKDRIEIINPSHPLKLAEENELTLRIHGAGLKKVETNQTQYGPEDLRTRLLPPSRPDGGHAILPVLFHPDGSAYIKVTPRRLGKVVLEIEGVFADSGFTKTDATLDVIPPSRIPVKLTVLQNGQTGFGVSFVYLKPETRRAWLGLSVVYDNLKEQISIDSKFAQFKIGTARNASIIALDSTTGYIKAIQPGEALVEADFGGLTTLECVVAREVDDPNHTGPPQMCRSLLRPGESLAVSKRSSTPK